MKRHFAILDGLRGTAAILVVAFHLMEASFPEAADNPLHHAYLAVDFFFLLSGFVVGYAYDDRWSSMSIKDFLRIRLIRLHPLVLLGVLIGAFGYWLDPFVGNAQSVSIVRMLLAVAVGMLLIPSPALPNRYDETHSLNGPCWSLLQEYLANIVYALIGPRIGKKALMIFVALAAVALAATAIGNTHLQGGWGWSNFWMAPARVAFPFFAGLLIFRLGVKIRIPMAYPLLSLLLSGVFALPYFKFNGAYEAACIILVFPIIIAAGAGSEISGRIATLCKFFGEISYPIYILHYPFIYIYTHWINERHPPKSQAIAAGIGLAALFTGMAWAALRFYDAPLRARLNARFRKPK